MAVKGIPESAVVSDELGLLCSGIVMQGQRSDMTERALLLLSRTLCVASQSLIESLCRSKFIESCLQLLMQVCLISFDHLDLGCSHC